MSRRRVALRLAARFSACLVAVLGAVCLAAPAAAASPPPPTSIVVDLDSGAVLEASRIDALRKPASIAKLMTVYLAFEAIAEGRIAPETPTAISAAAARQPPVKAWLSVGATVPFIDLVGATAIASSNDAAVAVAEAVAGSEEAFVARMNEAAAALGMTNTVYGTASGLPAEAARITARDVAILVRALAGKHADRLAFLGRAQASVGGRRLSTTNPLIGSYRGAKGLKTGFTCAAGYAIAALAERDGRRVVAVTLGHPSKFARNQAVRRLLDRGFGAADAPEGHILLGGPGVEPQAAPEAAPKPRPARRPDPAAASDGTNAAKVVAASLERAGDDLEVLAPAATRTPGAARSVRSCARGGGALRGWGALVGAYRSQGRANAAASQIAGGETYVFYRKRDRKWVALKHTMNRAGAIRTCAQARRAGRYCLTLPPAVLTNRRARWR